jgi:hypothetical protein
MPEIGRTALFGEIRARYYLSSGFKSKVISQIGRIACLASSEETAEANIKGKSGKKLEKIFTPSPMLGKGEEKL